MTSSGEHLLASASQARERVGSEWLDGLLDDLDREFPVKPEAEKDAQSHVEQSGKRLAEQGRYGA